MIFSNPNKTSLTATCASAAVFWPYQGSMGVADDLGRPHPSWQTLCEEFAPLMIEGTDFSFPKQNQCKVSVFLRTHGSVEVDLPAYTLRNYWIAWEFLSPTGKPLDLRGEADLPVLSPGTNYDLTIQIYSPMKGRKLHNSVIRPTGFIVIDRQLSISS